MAYDPGLNRLVALGGTYNPSFGTRFNEGQKFAQEKDMNAQVMDMRRQQMEMDRYAEQRAKQEEKRKQLEAYRVEQINKAKEIASYFAPVLTAKSQEESRKIFDTSAANYTKDTGMPAPEYLPGVTEQRISSLVRLAGTDLYKPNIKGGQPVSQTHLGSGKYVSHPEAPTKVEQGEPGSFMGDKDLVKLTESRRVNEQTLLKNIHGMRRLEKIVSDPNFLAGKTGDVVSTVNSIARQAEQLFGIDSIIDDYGNINESEIDPKSTQFSELRKKAIQNDAYSAALIEMAYLKAKLVDPASKITDKDFEFAKRMLASGADKASIINTLRIQQKFAIENYNQEEATAQGRFSRYVPSPYTEDKYRRLYNVEAPVQIDANSTPEDYAKDWLQRNYDGY